MSDIPKCRNCGCKCVNCTCDSRCSNCKCVKGSFVKVTGGKPQDVPVFFGKGDPPDGY